MEKKRNDVDAVRDKIQEVDYQNAELFEKRIFSSCIL